MQKPIAPESLFPDLEARGIVKQLTDADLPLALATPPLSLYAGFDPTSDSLHVGSLLPLLTLRRFQLAGHKPIAVIGGATGMIGDPSGKSQERSLLGPEQLEHNLKGIRGVISRFLELEGPQAARIVSNGEWFEDMSYIRFLREIGKHFTVNHMVAKESVRARLEDREHGISYTEFSYMLLQAYDFYHLNRTLGCRLQIGGSDQWGNITAGIELIRRMRAQEPGHSAQAERDPLTEVFGMTHPLVAKADGTKFGKTESGTIWLDAERTPVYQFYQFFIQTADVDVMPFLRYFTFLSQGELKTMEESLAREPEKRLAQLTLAREVTRLVHGEESLVQAEKASQALFGSAIKELDERTLLDVMAGAPTTSKPAALIQSGSALPGYALIDALAETGLCSSKGAARKDIAGGGIYVNNERVSDPAFTLKSDSLIAGRYVVLRKGKRTYHLLAFTE